VQFDLATARLPSVRVAYSRLLITSLITKVSERFGPDIDI
jgi:hypothetical protein